jgi:prepilin-type processing-associated H-X9-DG protein
MRLPRARFISRLVVALAALTAVAWWIVGILVENQARAERERCRNSLSQLALALCGFQEVRGSFPPGTLAGCTLPPEQRVSWVPLILSWTDYFQSIHFLFESDRPWDSPENLLPRIEFTSPGEPIQIIPSAGPPKFPKGLRCPANHCQVGPGLPGPIHYVGIGGLGTDAPSLPAGHPRAGVFGYDRRTRMVDIRDGAATTMLLAETTSANGPWTAGGPSTVRGLDPARRPYLGPGRQFGETHRGGAMIAFADGSVRFLHDTIDPEVFEALSTIAGGEVLPGGWDH